MSQFQVLLDGRWSNYAKEEDGILKRAYLSGHKKAKYNHRGNRYEYDFTRMRQKNLESGRERDIRPPHKMKPPSKPLVPSGPVMVVKVPRRSAGTRIQVPHPEDKSQMICVQVPAGARYGQEMMVPIPPLRARPAAHIPTPASGRIPAPSAPPASGYRYGALSSGDAPAASAPPAPADSDATRSADTTSKKPRKDRAGVGLAGVALVGGVVVAGGVVGDAIADSVGLDDGTIDGVFDAIGDGLEDAGEWLGDAGEDAGDFVMDLF